MSVIRSGKPISRGGINTRMAYLIESFMPDWRPLVEILSTLNVPGEFWLCRGAIRCDLLGELKDWDDFDVMAGASEEELHTAISKSELNVSRTFHGGYSLRLSTGRKVDLWSYSSTAGRQCGSLADALAYFEFNVDAIARSVRSGTLIDPFGVHPEIIRRRLRLLTPGTADLENPYLPWKAAYLVLRHRFVPDSQIVQLWRREPNAERIPDRAIPALRDELRCLGIGEELRGKVIGYPGFAAYLNVLAP